MDAQKLIELLKTPHSIQQHNVRELRSIINQYPYFQAARVLYLNGLKQIESFRYNNELKITAAYTTDRSVLFDFITSEQFNNTPATSKRSAEKPPLDDESKTETDHIKDDLQLGKPLVFNKNETHSFRQWLQIAAKKPVEKTNIHPKTSKTEKKLQDNIINQFITKNPKIPRINKAVIPQLKEVKPQKNNELMTETLAKVYLEQKKYDNAIKAYEILSLKYPEKSSFFADQINKIQILKNSK